MVITNTSVQNTQVILSPNRSMEWEDIKLSLLIICLPALIVGVCWLVVGAWIILAFVGIELAALTFLMYRVCYQNYQQQCITITNNQVIVESSIHPPSQAVIFTRPDCYLSIKEPCKPIENMELAIIGEHRSLTIGSFLNSTDRELARHSLSTAGLIELSPHWWKQH